MALDYNSLLLAIGFAGACLAVTLFITWFSSRTEGFLLTWALGILLIVGCVFAYSHYVHSPSPLPVMIAFGLLLSGLAVVLGAAIEFRTGERPVALVAIVAVAGISIALPPFVLGFDGLGFILTNLGVAGILFATARQYWVGRYEAPVPIIGLTILYTVTGASFALCGLVLISEGTLVVGHAPDNWAEDLSLIVSIAGVTGIGAMSLALNQWRLAGSHRRDALTDAHTGLLNRRALFDAFGDVPLSRDTAVIVFDLDDFKGINDRYGHAAGDRVLASFALSLRDNIRGDDVAARIGGEEFAVVLPRSTLVLAGLVAERIRASFAMSVIETDRGTVRCTVSAGVAFTGDGRQAFERVLSQADSALYIAKREGRNRVATQGLRLAG